MALGKNGKFEGTEKEYEEYLHTCYNESIFCPECKKKIVLKNIVDGEEC